LRTGVPFLAPARFDGADLFFAAARAGFSDAGCGPEAFLGAAFLGAVFLGAGFFS
jgi:hypothetical protein